MMEGYNSWEKPDPPKPKRWWVTRKLRACLIGIKDRLVYQSGMYPTARYSYHHWHWADGMLKRESGGDNPWSHRWDAFLERWDKL